jgi:hypothetical protein
MKISAFHLCDPGVHPSRRLPSLPADPWEPFSPTSTRVRPGPLWLSFANLITPAAAVAGGIRVRCRDRLGGLLGYYYRAA